MISVVELILATISSVSGTGDRTLETTELSKQPIKTRYLGHVTGCQPIKGQYLLIHPQLYLNPCTVPIRTLYLGHVTGCQPIRDQNPALTLIPSAVFPH